MDQNAAIILADAIKEIGPLIAVMVASFVPGLIFIIFRYKMVRVRVHGKDKVDAYKRLLTFLYKLQGRLYPLAENKRDVFGCMMAREYREGIEKDMIYFTKKIRDDLKNLDGYYTWLTDGEFSEERDPQRVRLFAEKELPKLVEGLVKKVGVQSKKLLY